MYIIWNIDKGMMLTASRRIDKSPTPRAEVFFFSHRRDRQDDKYPTKATTTTIL